MRRQSAQHFTYQALAPLVTHAFQDYLIPFSPTPEMLASRFLSEHVDLALSAVYRTDQDDCGVIFIARRGRESRIAAMAVSPGLRGQGIAVQMLTWAIDEARQRDDRSLYLEVLAHNAPALTLYQRQGFQQQRLLQGFRSSAQTGEAAASELTAVTAMQLVALMQQDNSLDLPWQVAVDSLQHLPAGAQGYALDGQGYALLVPVEDNVLQLRALYVLPAYRRRGVAGQLLRALRRTFPATAIVTPVAIPAALAPVFIHTEADFSPLALQQWEMRLSL